jgi:hypothetical protein
MLTKNIADSEALNEVAAALLCCTRNPSASSDSSFAQRVEEAAV